VSCLCCDVPRCECEPVRCHYCREWIDWNQARELSRDSSARICLRCEVDQLVAEPAHYAVVQALSRSRSFWRLVGIASIGTS
jgi:hypothetical protein